MVKPRRQSQLKISSEKQPCPIHQAIEMDYNDGIGEAHRTASESNHDAQYESEYDPLQKLSVSTVDTRKEPEAQLPPTPKSGKFPRVGTWTKALPKRPTFQSTLKKINDWWLIELGACLISLSAMLALILVIHHYDGKPLPKWPLRITIGTYIAVCSKVMSAMLLVPVVNSMSQYKWYMYQQSTGPLDAMGLVDNATRGTGGSISLLFKHRRYVFQTHARHYGVIPLSSIPWELYMLILVMVTVCSLLLVRCS